jgi:regulation of enolase protein 1 (concanavalin A-like superfamily)
MNHDHGPSTDRYLEESFTDAILDPRLRWFCEPKRWDISPSESCLRIEPDGGTDFWQRTHYGFQNDNGHFLFAELAGNFVLATRVVSRPVHQYDQAGLMVRHSPSCWLKTSIEYEPAGPGRLGVVVTNEGYSDWSTQDFPPGASEVWLRVSRQGSDYRVEFSLDGTGWSQIRLAHLHVPATQDSDASKTVACGLYACSPKGTGFVAEFGFLTIDVESDG